MFTRLFEKDENRSKLYKGDSDSHVFTRLFEKDENRIKLYKDDSDSHVFTRLYEKDENRSELYKGDSDSHVFTRLCRIPVFTHSFSIGTSFSGHPCLNLFCSLTYCCRRSSIYQ